MRRVLAGGLLFLVALGVAPPATAVDGDAVALSADGRRWGSELSAPLFDPAVRWVPGDSRTASFWVRNDGGDTGRLVITAQLVEPDGPLNGTVALRLRTAGTSVDLTPGRPTAVGTLRAGARTRAEVEAVFDPASSNVTQSERLRFAFDVTLSGDGPAATAGTSPGTSSGAPGAGGEASDGATPTLPGTGAEARWWWLVAAAALVGGGGALVVRNRRAPR